MLDLDRGLDEAVAALGERMLTDVAKSTSWRGVELPQEDRGGPGRFARMVYARLPSAARTLTASVNGHRRSLPVIAGAPALVGRAVAAAEIGELEIRLAGARATPRRRARPRSPSAPSRRVVSSQTSMLVLGPRPTTSGSGSIARRWPTSSRSRPTAASCSGNRTMAFFFFFLTRGRPTGQEARRRYGRQGRGAPEEAVQAGGEAPEPKPAEKVPPSAKTA